MPETSQSNKHPLDLSNISYKMGIAILAAVLFSAYGPKITSDLPDTIRVFFENSVARFAVIVLIIYLGNNNLELSLLIAAAISLMMLFVHKYEIRESLSNKIHEDFFIKRGAIEQFGVGDQINVLTNRLKQATNVLTGNTPSSTPSPTPTIKPDSPSSSSASSSTKKSDSTLDISQEQVEATPTPDHHSTATPEHESTSTSEDHSTPAPTHHSTPAPTHHSTSNSDDHKETFVNYQPTGFHNRVSHFNVVENNINQAIQQYKGEI